LYYYNIICYIYYYSIETVADAIKVYLIGDLGFEPKHIKVDEIHKEIERAHSVLSDSPTIFKEFDKLSSKFIQVQVTFLFYYNFIKLYIFIHIHMYFSCKHENSVISIKKNSHDSISISSSLSSMITSQNSINKTESINYTTENKIETIIDMLSEIEEDGSKYDLKDEYEDYMDYGQE
jgi:hypothetical protein